MRRSAGAIFRDNRPATIIRSDCRGLPRNTSAPNRAMSYRPQLIAIISIAQHARPNVTGQIDERRAHWTSLSTCVVSTGRSSIGDRPSSIVEGWTMVEDDGRSPIDDGRSMFDSNQRTFLPDVDVTRQEHQREEQYLHE